MSRAWVAGAVLCLVMSGCGGETSATDGGALDAARSEDAAMATSDGGAVDGGPTTLDAGPSCPLGCEIDGVCHAEGDVRPTNPCEACVRATSATSWTALDGQACDDGLYCTDADACAGATCTGAPRDCSDGIACTGIEACDEDTDACVAGTSPCGAGTTCDETSGLCVAAATCPCWADLQVLRDDLATYDAEFVGSPSCVTEMNTADTISYGFYRPGCTPATCGSWSVGVRTFEAFDPSVIPPRSLGLRTTCASADSYDGVPPPNRSATELTAGERHACVSLVRAFALERGCP